MRDKMMELPKAYAFPKEKDLQKGRPIVSYRKHVLRREAERYSVQPKHCCM